MGLDITHDAWSGAYGAFSRWRDALAEAAGYELAWIATGELFEDDRPPVGKWVPTRRIVLIDWGHIHRKNYDGEWDQPPADPLILLIAHSDCDGHLEPEHCALLADRLTELLPSIPEGANGGGHLGNIRATTERFIAGCRVAAEAGERLEFG
jgi:hypothetical protein